MSYSRALVKCRQYLLSSATYEVISYSRALVNSPSLTSYEVMSYSRALVEVCALVQVCALVSSL